MMERFLLLVELYYDVIRRIDAVKREHDGSPFADFSLKVLKRSKEMLEGEIVTQVEKMCCTEWGKVLFSPIDVKTFASRFKVKEVRKVKEGRVVKVAKEGEYYGFVIELVMNSGKKQEIHIPFTVNNVWWISRAIREWFEKNEVSKVERLKKISCLLTA